MVNILFLSVPFSFCAFFMFGSLLILVWESLYLLGIFLLRWLEGVLVWGVEIVFDEKIVDMDFLEGLIREVFMGGMMSCSDLSLQLLGR